MSESVTPAAPPLLATAADVADLKAAVVSLQATVAGAPSRRVSSAVGKVVGKMASAVPTGKVAWTAYGASAGITAATVTMPHVAAVVAAVAAYL